MAVSPDIRATTEAPQTEAPKAPERKTPSPENLKADINSLTNSMIHQKQTEVREESKGKNERETEAILNQDKGKRAIHDLETLENLGPGAINLSLSVPENHPDYNPIKLTIETDGVEESVIVKGIERVNEDGSFKCNVEVVDGARGTVRTIPREKVILGFLKTEAASILTQFTEEEQKVIQLYIDSLAGQDNITAENAEEVRKIILEAAKNIRPSSENLITFARKVIREEIAEDGNLTPQQKMKNENRKKQLEEIEKILEGTDLPNENQIVEVIKIAGFSETTLEYKSVNADQVLEQLEAQCKHQPNNKKLKDQLERAKTEARFWKMAAQSLKGDGLSKYFKAIQDGNITQEKAKLLNEALEEGDIDKILENLLPDLPPEIIALINYKKGAGIGMLLLGILLNSFNEEFMKPQQ